MRFGRFDPRSFNRWLCLLLLAVARAAAADGPADTPESPLQEIAQAGEALVRGAALPAWADLLALPAEAPSAGRAASVVRLWETQLLAGPAPVRLTQRVVQVHEASALAEIGQLAIEFTPQFEQLSLHKLLIWRSGQSIDNMHTARVRLLQREARLEEGVYSGLITASIVLPGVRVGDTLQLVYSISGDNPALRGRTSYLALWDQGHAVALRRVTLVAPVDRLMRWRWIGGAGGHGPGPTETVTAGLRRLRFDGRDLAAVTSEPMMPAHVLPLRRLQFSEYADWNEVARWALQQFPPHAALPPELGPLMARLRALAEPQERVSEALQWVQNEIRHWSVAVGDCALRPQPPALVVARRWGDCKDKALLLSTMLRELGISARPALVSLVTRSGPASMLPAPDLFDHVIVQVKLDGREYYLDPTNQGQAGLLSRLGQRLEGAAVLPIDAETQALVIVRSPNRDEIFRNRLHERLSLDEFGGDGRLEVDTEWVGATAESLRLLLSRMEPAELRRFVAAGYEEQYAGSRLVGEPEISDDRRLNRLRIHALFSVPQLAQAVGRGWAVSFAPSLGNDIALPSQPRRRFPLALASFPMTHNYRVDMTWPEGATIDDEPAHEPLETPHFELRTTSSVRGNTESRTIELTLKVGEVPADEVPTFAADLHTLRVRIGGLMVAKMAGVPLRP